MTGLARRVVALAAFAGFGLSLIVHVAALFGTDVATRVPAVWLLHIGIFAVFIPLIVLTRQAPRQRPAEILSNFPPWVVTLGGVILLYALVNFALFLYHTQDGNPGSRNGKFVLMSHGHVMRELTPAEYTAFRANEARGFSGHWLFFYYFPFAYFALGRRSPTGSAS